MEFKSDAIKDFSSSNMFHSYATFETLMERNTKFVPFYAWIFIDQVESKFLPTQSFNLLYCLGTLMMFSSSRLMANIVSNIL